MRHCGPSSGRAGPTGSAPTGYPFPRLPIIPLISGPGCASLRWQSQIKPSHARHCQGPPGMMRRTAADGQWNFARQESADVLSLCQCTIGAAAGLHDRGNPRSSGKCEFGQAQSRLAALPQLGFQPAGRPPQMLAIYWRAHSAGQQQMPACAIWSLPHLPHQAVVCRESSAPSALWAAATRRRTEAY
jgi:hypothetical protein